jgi:germination protein M
MSARVLLILVAALAAVIVLVWVLGGGPSREVAPSGTGEPRVPPTPTPAPLQRVMLLFAGDDGRLHPELREVPLPAELHERARIVVSELLAGPTAGLAPVVPYPAQVNAVFVDPSGLAFIDITAPPQPLEGSNIELMLVYGVVDSVLLNCPELRAVQILFGGAELPTLTGHLDLSKPLVLNRRFIAS